MKNIKWPNLIGNFLTAFAAGVAAGMSQGLSLEKALMTGTVAAIMAIGNLLQKQPKKTNGN